MFVIYHKIDEKKVYNITGAYTLQAKSVEQMKGLRRWYLFAGYESQLNALLNTDKKHSTPKTLLSALFS